MVGGGGGGGVCVGLCVGGCSVAVTLKLLTFLFLCKAHDCQSLAVSISILSHTKGTTPVDGDIMDLPSVERCRVQTVLASISTAAMVMLLLLR